MLLRLYDFTMLVIFVWVLHDNLLTIDAVILMILTYISSAFCICVLLWCSYMAVISNNFWCKLEVACIVLHPPVAFIFVVAEMLLYTVFFTCPVTAFSFAWHIFALHVASILVESTGCLCIYGIHFTDYLRNYFPSSSSVFKYVLFTTSIYLKIRGEYCLILVALLGPDNYNAWPFLLQSCISTEGTSMISLH